MAGYGVHEDEGDTKNLIAGAYTGKIFEQNFFKFFNGYLFLRERERDREAEHEQGEGQRERQTHTESKAGSRLSAQSPTWGSNSQTMRS